MLQYSSSEYQKYKSRHQAKLLKTTEMEIYFVYLKERNQKQNLHSAYKEQ